MKAYVWTLLLAASYFWVGTSGSSTNFTLCFEGHCYLQRSDSRLSWFDAIDYCAERDADLPSIHSSEQNEYISVNVCMSSSCWIGLVEEQENVWVWVDGTVLNYTNWAAEEPNNYMGRKEDRAHLWNGGTWNDHPSTSREYVICMRSSNSTRFDPTSQPTFDPSKWPTSPPTADPTTQPTFDPTKWLTLPSTAQSKSSVISDQLVMVLVSLMIITILWSIAVCALCRWGQPMVRRDARNKGESDKLGPMRVDDEPLKLEVVPISPDDDTHEGCTTTMELNEEKNHRSPATELQDLESSL